MVDNLLSDRTPVEAVSGDVEEHVQLAEVLGITRGAVVTAVALTEGRPVLLDDLPDDLTMMAVQLGLCPFPRSQSQHSEQSERLEVDWICSSLEERKDELPVDGEKEGLPQVPPEVESGLVFPGGPRVSARHDVDPEIFLFSLISFIMSTRAGIPPTKYLELFEECLSVS